MLNRLLEGIDKIDEYLLIKSGEENGELLKEKSLHIGLDNFIKSGELKDLINYREPKNIGEIRKQIKNRALCLLVFGDITGISMVIVDKYMPWFFPSKFNRLLNVGLYPILTSTFKLPTLIYYMYYQDILGIISTSSGIYANYLFVKYFYKQDDSNIKNKRENLLSEEMRQRIEKLKKACEPRKPIPVPTISCEIKNT